MTESPPPLVHDKETPGSPAERSLLDDVKQLFEDGQTYVEAEIAFQATRGQYVLDKVVRAGLFGLLATVFLVIALITASVGAVLALRDLGIWVAIGIVVAFWLLATGLVTWRMLRAYRKIRAVFDRDRKVDHSHLPDTDLTGETGE